MNTHAWLYTLFAIAACSNLSQLYLFLHTIHALKLGKTVFHIAAKENSRECLKLLVYHFKVDPDEPDFVSFNIHTVPLIVHAHA